MCNSDAWRLLRKYIDSDTTSSTEFHHSNENNIEYHKEFPLKRFEKVSVLSVRAVESYLRGFYVSSELGTQLEFELLNVN